MSRARAASTQTACGRCRRGSWPSMMHLPGEAAARTQVRVNDQALEDAVPRDAPGIQEIGFSLPERYNAGAILFDNLAAGRGSRPAVTGPAGARTYAELAADAERFG